MEDPCIQSAMDPKDIETLEELNEKSRVNARRQADFLNYLRKKRIAKAKEEERQSTATREREFLEQERQDRWLSSQGLLCDELEEDLTQTNDDYVIDEIEVYDNRTELEK